MNKKSTQSNTIIIKGYVRFVDNPAVVNAMVRSLAGYGVPEEDITVGEMSRTFVQGLEPGTELVVNSLFDLSPEMPELLQILSGALSGGIVVVSLSDGGCRISGESLAGGDLLNILGRYAAMSSKPSEKTEARPARRGRPCNFTPARVNSYRKAMCLYRQGMSMLQATKTAGCNYQAFRYWYNNNFRSGESGGSRP